MGNYQCLEILALLFSAISGVISLGAYYYVYSVARDIIGIQGNYAALNTQQLQGYGWSAVMYIAMSFGFYGLALICSHITAFNTVANVRIKLIRHLEKLPLGFHNTHASGKMRKQIEKNTNELEHYIAHQLPDTAQAMVTPVAFLIFIFWFDWRLALVCLIPVLIGFLLLKFMLGGESQEFLKVYQTSAESMGNDVVEYIRGVAVVKVFGQTVFSFKNFSDSIEKYRDYLLKYALSMKKHMSGYIAAVYGIFAFLVPAAILLFNLGTNQREVVLSFIFFVIFMPMVAVLLMRIMESSYNSMILERSLDTIEVEILRAEPLPQNDSPKKLTGYDVVFENVDFSYDENMGNAIRQLTFTAPTGTVTALVGPSGGGKTTVLNLIARFWDAANGRIRIGGTDVRELDYENLMSNIGIVFQETSLFKMSIADNVTFLKPGAAREEIIRALHLAQCDDILEKLPNGINTVIGTKGVYLSGGEMQRIAIARAILKDAPILLLDEATAFADSENEYKIQQALSTLMQGKTVFMIAHRLSTITGADQILVMSDGSLIEKGRHHELMKLNNLYAEMYREYQKSSNWRIGGKAHA
ncbi:MAG: ABC transporter ATP-binding protein [Lachnospiraceae bacterium]